MLPNLDSLIQDHPVYVNVKDTFFHYPVTERIETKVKSAPAKVAVTDRLKPAVQRFRRALSELPTCIEADKLQISENDRKSMVKCRKELERELVQVLRALQLDANKPKVAVYITNICSMGEEERTRLGRDTGSGQGESFTLPSSRDANEMEKELHRANQKKKEEEGRAKQKEETEQQKSKQDPSEYLSLKLHTWWTSETVRLWTGYDQPCFSTKDSGLEPEKAEIILQAASVFSPIQLRRDCWITFKPLGELDDNDAQKFHHNNNTMYEMKFDATDESIKFPEVPKAHLPAAATATAAPAQVLNLESLFPDQLTFLFTTTGGVEQKSVNPSNPDEVRKLLKDYFTWQDFGGREDDQFAWKHVCLHDRFAERNKESLIDCARRAKMNGCDPYELRLERPDRTLV